MIQIKNWRAKRAGGLITVYGDDAYGDVTKITKVEAITPGPRGAGYCVARGQNGNEHHLMLD